ncbi:protein CUSTOS [Bufo gargarizans]|uniref:protein CUSTOS n=1 Tax=Bufo gargarizans TaxID=30331 RepID=UPI001CF57CA3|nr:protein CUSTOS [Bufo gargarizans]
MAAPRSSWQEAESDSSSGAEDLERFREAAWEPPGSVKKIGSVSREICFSCCPKLTVCTVKYHDQILYLCQSPLNISAFSRVRPNSHEHDGNELQTTPEFRTHVAKKLAAMLDSCIREIPGSNSFNQESAAASDSEDEGFRLLTTSVPGDCRKILSSPTLKRRAASSTSEDSEEEEQRCREAAVSGLDILKHSALQTTLVERIETDATKQPKKKKKKKAKKDRGLSGETETDDQNMEPKGNINGFKKKKKEREMSDKTDSHEKTILPGSEKINPESDCYNKSKTVKDQSKKKKKEMGLNQETTPDHDINTTCGTKKKKKKVAAENCDEHD